MRMSHIGLDKSIYTKKLLDEFATFQDSHAARRAYLVETADLAPLDGMREGNGTWL